MGATVESDRLDFAKMWGGYCPDEIKIYPTQLLKNAELYLNWQRGEYQPYTTEELVEMIDGDAAIAKQELIEFALGLPRQEAARVVEHIAASTDPR